MGVIRRWLKRGLWLGVAILAVTIAVVLYFSDANWRRYGAARGLSEPVDAVLVLGGGVDADGVLSYSSRRRVRLAVYLLEKGLTRRLIFLGGSKDSPRSLTGGELMRKYAIALGAPEEALSSETRSLSTFENLRFGFALVEAQGVERLAILTDAFHLERARWLAAYFGRPDVALVAAPGLALDNLGVRVWSILREALAWWYNLGKIAAWEGLAYAGIGESARGNLIR